MSFSVGFNGTFNFDIFDLSGQVLDRKAEAKIQAKIATGELLYGLTAKTIFAPLQPNVALYTFEFEIVHGETDVYNEEEE